MAQRVWSQIASLILLAFASCGLHADALFHKGGYIMNFIFGTPGPDVITTSSGSIGVMGFPSKLATADVDRIDGGGGSDVLDGGEVVTTPSLLGEVRRRYAARRRRKRHV